MSLVIDFFLVAGMIVSTIILLLLFKSVNKELPQKLLMVFFSILMLFIIHAYADVHNIEILWILSFIFNDALELLVGPILLLYVKSLFENNKTLFSRNWYHFIVLGLYMLFISLPMLVSVIKGGFVFKYLEFLSDNSLLMFTILLAYLIIYMLWSLKLFLKYKAIMPLNFSTIPDADLVWVRNMLIGSIIVATVGFVINISDLVSEIERDTNWITLIFVVILITHLGYYGVKQTKILLPDFLIQELNTSNKKVVSKTHITINNEEYENSKNLLIQVLEQQKVYLDEELTLNKLASQIPITDKKLSFLLNQYMGTTFYDFINKYRVESVKEKLANKDYEHITLLGIAFESGFKSKTSFNRIFKKETGLSPSEYKKAL